jgi:pimeloyl-ACP methyl ester carboxylesterase
MNVRDFGLRTRTYGKTGPELIVLHGGPAAVGEAEPIARGLSPSFRVLEPFQRGSSDQPLTVAVHVEDLHRLVEGVSDDTRPSIVGESWGAMLGLAYASTYPGSIAALVLIGCGTFDAASRRAFDEVIDSRLDEASREKLQSLSTDYSDPEERLRERHRLTAKAYAYDPIPADEQLELKEPFDMRAHREAWDDMLGLQERGVYPAAFSRIKTPVLMLHGAYDPHPGRLVRASLQAHMPHLEYYELANCGHSPWRERQSRKEFFMVMRNWLLTHCDMQEDEV